MLKDLFDFRGRTGRRRFWRIYLLLSAAIAGCWVAGLLLALTVQVGWLGVLAIAPAGVGLAAYAALLVRRLHDRGKSGWWLLLFYGVPVLMLALGRWLDADEAGATAAVLALISLGVTVWGLVEIGLRRGAPGPNRYGPAPA